jgi:hypothetical protein
MATFSNLSDAAYQEALDKLQTRQDAIDLAEKLGFSKDNSFFLKMGYSEAEFAGGMIYAEANQGPIDKLINASVSMNGGIQGEDNFLLTFQNSISQALTPIAYCIALIFFILALIDLGMSERMNLDSFTKFFARLAVGIFMIDNCQLFLTFGNAVADWMSQLITDQGSLGSGAGSAQNMFNQINSIMPDHPIARQTQAAMAAMFKAFQFVPLFLILTTLVSRLMEISIRGALMPIAFSFATEEGWRGTAIRYLKRYIALLAMGPLIMVVFTAGNRLQMGVTSFLGTGAGFFLQILVNPVIGFAEVGIIKKLQSVVSEAFGA